MRRFHLATALLIAAGAQASGQAHAQAITDADRSYLQDQAQEAAYELAIAHLADETSARPDLRGYAQIVITNHEELDEQLARLAKSNGVTLAASMRDGDKPALKRLQAMKGREFDRAYIQEANRTNEADEKKDAAEAGQTQDAAMQTFAKELQRYDEKHAKLSKALDGQD